MPLITKHDLGLAKELIDEVIAELVKNEIRYAVSGESKLQVKLGAALLTERRRVLRFIEDAVRGGDSLQSVINLLRSASPK